MKVIKPFDTSPSLWCHSLYSGSLTLLLYVLSLLHFSFLFPPRYVLSVVIYFFSQFSLPCIAVMYWTSCPSSLFLYFQRLYLYLFQLLHRNMDFLFICVLSQWFSVLTWFKSNVRLQTVTQRRHVSLRGGAD